MHIAIVLDGNRRWGRSKGLTPYKGHIEGAKNVRKLLDWCKEIGVKELTLYCFSIQNFKRTEVEKKFLFKLFREYASSAINHIGELKKNKVRVKIIGRKKMLGPELKKLLCYLECITKDYKKYKLNICLAYGGREEIIDAIKKIKDPKRITEEKFKKLLYLDSEPDIIIRTGGENRTSNFLVFQSTYSEWFFVKKYWPDFTKEDLRRIIKEYKKRERRYGM